jgi:hypothetical protein
VLRVGAVGPGETREIGEIVLGPGTTFEACFVDAGGAPLEQAEVTTPDPWMPRGAQATGPAGTVRLTKVPLHPFVLHIGPTSKTPATFVRADPSASSATFTIREGALIEGRVVDALARPVAGAVVRFRSLRDEVTGTETDDSVLADAEGRFACRLRAGRATIRAYSADQRSIIDDVELTVSEGEHRAVNFAAQ